MPNWCDNTIEVTGKAKDVKKFDEQFKKEHEAFYGSASTCPGPTGPINGKEGCIECRIVKRQPLGMQVSYEVNHLNEIVKKCGYSFSNFVPMGKDDFLNGWYDWSCNNWGTKWDLSSEEVYVSGLDLIENVIEEDLEVNLIYSFNTAWSPCTPAVAEMARQYTDLTFVHEYDECGMCFAGKIVYENGVKVLDIDQDSEGGYREFTSVVLGKEYCKCQGCGQLLDDCEIDDNDGKCPECGSKDILDIDGQKYVTE